YLIAVTLCGSCSRAARQCRASFPATQVVETGATVQGRRRLVLLAVIIVAVAIGAVGLTIVSLFEATLAETRDNLSLRVDELAAGARPSGNSTSLVLVDGEWRVALGAELPADLRANLASQPVTPGRLQWLDSPAR